MSWERRAKQRECSICPACFSTKAGYAAFLLLKNLNIGRDVSEAGLALFN